MITTKWPGGKTSQIYISPESRVFGKDAFDFRISLATVEKQETTYTPFPDVMRNLLVVDGKITLVSMNESIQLSPGDRYIFSGSDHLQCFGTSTNFNLMYNRSKFKTELKMISNSQFSIEKSNYFSIIYPLKGNVTLYSPTEAIQLDETEYWIGKSELINIQLHEGDMVVLAILNLIG